MAGPPLVCLAWPGEAGGVSWPWLGWAAITPVENVKAYALPGVVVDCWGGEGWGGEWQASKGGRGRGQESKWRRTRARARVFGSLAHSFAFICLFAFVRSRLLSCRLRACVVYVAALILIVHVSACRLPLSSLFSLMRTLLRRSVF